MICSKSAPNLTEVRVHVSNKSFIHSPVKEKAKTSKIEFWPYQQIRGDISVPGIIDKT
jgi:hypothetical protein